jgi:hypothetical protein
MTRSASAKARRCNEWLRENPEFAALYKSSLNDRLDVFAEQSLQIADGIKNDFKTIVKNGKEKRVVDPAGIVQIGPKAFFTGDFVMGMPLEWQYSMA